MKRIRYTNTDSPHWKPLTPLLLAVAGLILIANLTFAQPVPPMINYQGRLVNSNGVPLATGDYELAISGGFNGAILVARWDFENNYNDSVGGYHLVQRGTVPFVSGQCDTAVEFDGGIVTNSPSSPPLDALDAATAPNPTNFNSGFSVMRWMRHNQAAQGTGGYNGGLIIAQSGWQPGINDRGWAIGVGYEGRLDIALRDAQDDRNNAGDREGGGHQEVNSRIALGRRLWCRLQVMNGSEVWFELRNEGGLAARSLKPFMPSNPVVAHFLQLGPLGKSLTKPGRSST